jgi:outer membrane protein assembly factor BamD
MRAFRHLPLVFSVFVLFTLASCAESVEKIRKSSDVNYKLTKANEYYDKKKYAQASELYHDLLPVLRGTKNYEQLFYRYAYSFFYQGQYSTAALYFKNFSEYFPASKDVEETEYMYALCLVKDAPKSNLDQTNTIHAMEALQSFINTHPHSKRLNEANDFIEAGRKKLEKKESDAALLYFNIGQYKAASVSYKYVLDQYPDSPEADYYQFMVVRSLYEYAKISIPERQAERYVNTKEAYSVLKASYPSSKYVKDGEWYDVLASTNLKKIQ